MTPPSELHVEGTGPEHLFGVPPVRRDGDVFATTMPTGPWLAGDDGRGLAGSLGVAIDNAIGYAIVHHRAESHWSVSTEIAIDVVGEIPLSSGLLRSEGQVVHRDDRTGFSLGTVTDEAGRVIAHARQRGRYVSHPGAITAYDDPEERRPGTTGTGVADLLLDPTYAVAREDGLDLVTPGLLCNPLGNLHGGITLCLADLLASLALAPGGDPLSTASLHVAYVRSVPLGTPLRLTATVLHRSRTLGVAHVIGTRPDGKPCTIATVTQH